MANLVDTSVNGDIRVTGKIYGTVNAIRLGNANLAIPPLGDGDQVGSTGDFFIDSGSGKNLPDTTNNFNIHTTVTHFNGTTYRLSQIATPTSASNPTGIYERGASSSDGVTWTFGSWLAAANSSHSHGNIGNGGTLTDTAAAAAGNDYVVIRDADNSKIQTSTIKGTDVADAVSKKHSHSTLTLSTTAQAYDGSHTLALPSTDPYTSARTPTSHTHGNITNGGALQTNDITIASGDKLVVTDSSDSSKVARASISFDGSTTTKALTQKGTFESFAKAGDITTAIQALDVSSVGGDGKYISAISETDGKISATTTTMDTTPTASSTNAVTSGGIKTALDGKVSKSGDTMTGGLEIQGVKSGTSYAQSGGGYNANYNNIILRGDPTYGVSGILFTSSKGTTSINQPTDRGFIQFHSMGVTPVAEGSTPTMSSSGEANSLVIGVGNDSDDEVWIQTPATSGIKHVVGPSKYTVYDGANLPAASSASAVATTSSAGSASTFSRGDHVHSLPLAASGTRGGIQIGYSESGTNYAVKLSSEKAYVTVPWTDTKVTQTADNSSTGTGFEVLFSATADNTTRTESSRKSNKLTFQPSTGTLTATKFSGPLTGNVTGNCSGSSGSCTGNAATATTATKATQDSDGKQINTTYLKLAGGTMTGKITAQAGQYTDDNVSCAINMNNSNIIGLNSIYTADASDGASEGIHFYRDATHVDTLWMAGGALYFVPNRALGTSTSAADSQKVARLPASITDNQVVLTNGTAGALKTSAASSLTVGTATNANNAKVTTKTDGKIYLAGALASGYSSGGNAALYTDTGIYATATSGQLHATTFDVNSKCTLQFNTTTNALDFVFA